MGNMVCSVLVIQLLTGYRHRSYITFPFTPGHPGFCRPHTAMSVMAGRTQMVRAGWILAVCLPNPSCRWGK